MQVYTPKGNRPMRVAVLISGTGRSLRNMIERIETGSLAIEIGVVVASTPNARGLQYAEKAGVPLAVVERKDFPSRDEYSDAIFQKVREAEVDLVAMAGFIKRITMPEDFANRVVNIHPSLIPAFCGKGFYGHHVHEAALEYGVKISGCTVHFVDNQYDNGPVILQMSVPVLDDDTLDALEARVFTAECEAYPRALQLIATGRVSVFGRRVRVAPA